MDREPSILKLVKILADLLPGIEKGLCLIQPLANASSIQVGSIAFQPVYTETWQDAPLESVDCQIFLTKDSNAEWISEEEVPFHEAPRKAIARDLFSPLGYNTLFVRLFSVETQKCVLCFLFFSKSNAGPGLPLLKAGMDKSAQLLSASLIQHSLSFMLKEFEQANSESNAFAEKTRNVISRLNAMREDLKEKNKSLTVNTIDYCSMKISSLGSDMGVNFLFSEGIKKRIEEFKGNLDDLVQSLLEAAKYAFKLHRDLKVKDIVIDEWYVMPTTTTSFFTDAHTMNQERNPILGGLSRSMDVLDKWEQACKELMLNNLKITSVNVGHHCPTPISAPAISDSVRTHKLRFLNLLHSHPDRWPLLRSRFRPIIRIMEENSQSLERETA